MIIVAALIMAMLAGSYLLLQKSSVQTYIIKKITEKISLKTNAKISVGKVEFVFFNRVVLEDVLLADPQNDTIFYTSLVSAKIDTFDFRKRRISLGELAFTDNMASVVRNSNNHFNFSFILDSLQTEKKDTSIFWSINCNQFSFNNLELAYNDLQSDIEKRYFIDEMNMNISDFSNYADSTSFKINSLALKYNNNITINDLTADVIIKKGFFKVDSLNMKTDGSEINDLNLSLQLPAGEYEELLNKNINFDIELKNSVINISELAEFVPALREMDESIEISGKIYGKLNDLKGKNLTLKTGERTYASFDFYVNDLQDIETMYLFIDLKKLETTMKDISDFKIVSKGKEIQLHIPEAFYDAGVLSYTGNFSGFLSDFVAFGTLRSRMGIIKTDISVIPKKNGVYSYRGKIATTNFELGRMLKTDNVGRITFNGNADGDYEFSDKKISGLFKGEITQLEALDYVYENIKLDGYYKDKMFDGMLSMNDSNLQFSFQGRWDASKELPNFNFSMNVEKFVPGKLNISGNYYQAEMGFNMKANFTGNKIDNLKGVIVVDDGFYKNKNGSFNLDGIKLISVPQDSTMELSFDSNYFDIRVNGIYEFQDIWNSLKNNMNKFIPAIGLKSETNVKTNLFNYWVIVKNLDDLTAVFAPDIKIETPFFLYGKMDSNQSDFQLEGSIPGFQYKNFRFSDIFVSNKVFEDQYVSKIKFGEIINKSGTIIHNLSFESEIKNNILNNSIAWYTYKDSTGYSEINGVAEFTESKAKFPNVKINFQPSEIYLTDTLWQLDGFSAKIDSSKLVIDNFKLFKDNQNIEIAGNISKDSIDVVSVNFNNIDLAYLQKNISERKTVKGILNGSVSISQLLDQPVFLADAKINKLEFKNQPIGDVVLTSSWNRLNSEIESELEITNNQHRSLVANGTFNPRTKAVNYTAKADSLPLNLLETVISTQFSDFTGTTSGVMKIGGTANKILMDGVMKVAHGGILIDYTQTKYFIDDSIYFKSDTIQFQNLTFTDVNKNSGKLNGILAHDNFRNMLYDLTIVSPKVKVLNTTMRNNELFYGEAFANCKLRVQGRGLRIALSGSLTSLAGTEINISMEYENSIEQYDFLEFINPAETTDKDLFFYDPPKTDFTINFNVEITPDAKVQLIYNSQIGDVIKGEGEGIMLFEMNKYGDISLAGDYTVTKGDYLFTLQSILNKRFTIAPGGTIVWSGDPYNAIIDLKAIYSLKTSLDDLLRDNSNNSNYLYQRIPVDCIILLTNELINPTINFEINFPDEKEDLKNQVQPFINTEDEVNRQILSLIVLGKFYTPEYMPSKYQSQNPNMFGSTASELLSNQLSNWLSQLNKNIDVGFKYRPGNSITNDELELALSTQIFNDRVILNGNIGNNVNPESNNSSQIVGDFDMRVKLTPNGKIQLKAYNHSNNDLIYEIAPYTQGVGISFKEEYNSFQELIRKIGSIFTKKEE